MVHALEKIHQLLAPGGRLVDIHPLAQAPLIEIHARERITFSEPAPDYPLADIEHAEQALAHVVREGLFAIEREGAFDFRTYAPSVAELVEYLKEQGSLGDGRPDEADMVQREEMIAHVERLMRAAGEGAKVALHERARITVLRPAAYSARDRLID